MQTNKEPKFEASSYCRLNPITSLNTSRYDSSGCVRLCPWVITRGPASRSTGSVQAPRSLTLCTPSETPAETSTSSASKWRRFVHPEGQSYFVLTGGFDFAVVTEANVEDVQTERRILDCVNEVNNELQAHNVKVPPRCELFLELGDDCTVCNYYFIDQIERGLFWLDDLSTELLGIPAAMSSSHLESVMERLYWVHVEFFPMHHESHEQEFSQIVDDLYNIILQGQADRLTPRTSTFPYTADTYKQFLKLLSRERGQRVDGYTLCYGARLAVAIMNQRFVTFHGQQSAQLDRLQEMFPADVVEHKWLSNVVNMLMWGVPGHYHSLLEELYVDEQLGVYADRLPHFMSNCLADWTNSLSRSLPIIIANILLANVRGGTVSTSIPSVLSCAVSIASASCLHLRHRLLAESGVGVGARYIPFAKWNNVGFLTSSVAFGLPRASYLWGVGLLTAQSLFIVFHTVNRPVALLAACVIAAIMIFTLCVIYPEDANIASLFRSLTSLCMPHMHTVDAREGESIV